jgi:hypothetical protein
MRVEKDYEELLRLFNKYKVKYCIVGAYALAFYARPRYTKDMDIFIFPDDKNAEKVVQALSDFGFGSLDINKNDLNREGKIIQLGYEPVRIDLITGITGCRPLDVWKSRSIGIYGREKIYFIGRRELLKNKKTMGRFQDLNDLELLKKKKTKK